MTILVTSLRAEEPTKLVFRETLAGSRLSTCNQITLHAATYETTFETTFGKASISIGQVPILKGELPFEKVAQLAARPIASPLAAHEHWFDVCSARWYLLEQERMRLQTFIAARRESLASTATPVAAPAPADPLDSVEAVDLESEEAVAPAETTGATKTTTKTPAPAKTPAPVPAPVPAPATTTPSATAPATTTPSATAPVQH